MRIVKYNMKTVMTVSGIRPDFIRMSAIFKKLDEDQSIKHVLVHTGQHYDQLSYLSIAIMELIRLEDIKPDIILFLGDSNTVCAALPLRKEGYIVGHIEAGMRSFDKRMLEEINRTVCDHCSHIHFVYHDEYKKFLHNENIKDNVHVVGNTIVEVCRPFIPSENKRNDMILLDIHRPENFKHKHRMEHIIKYANSCIKRFGLPIKMLNFGRTTKYLKEYGIDANCSYMLDVNSDSKFEDSWNWLSKIENKELTMDIKWLGDGNTSELVVTHLKQFLL